MERLFRQRGKSVNPQRCRGDDRGLSGDEAHNPVRFPHRPVEVVPLIVEAVPNNEQSDDADDDDVSHGGIRVSASATIALAYGFWQPIGRINASDTPLHVVK